MLINLNTFLVSTLAKAIIVSGLGLSTPGNEKTAAEESQKKAEYIYMEAAGAKARGNLADYYMLMRKAEDLNPSDPYIAGALAEIEVQMPDSTMSAVAYKKIKERFLASPEDDEFANSFISVAHDTENTADLIEAYHLIQAAHPDRTTPTVMLADTYAVEAQKPGNEAYADSALAIYSDLLSRQGFVPYLLARKLSVYAGLDCDSCIREELLSLHASAPRDPKIQIFMAQCYASLQQSDSALVALSRAEKLDPTLPEIYSTRAEVYRDMHNDEAYATEVERAIQIPNLPFENKFQLWSDYMRNFASDSVQEPEIRRLFKVLEEDHPDEPLLHNLYGSYLQFRDDIQGAIEQFDYSVNLDPENSDTWGMRIGAYSAQNNAEELERVVRGSLEYFPDQTDMRFLLGLTIAMQGRTKEGVETISGLLPISDRSKYWASGIYELRANSFQDSQELDSIIAYFGKALEVFPDNYGAMNNLAYILAKNSRDLDRSEMYAILATGAEPYNPTYIDTYAWVLFKKNKLDDARKEIDKAMRILGVFPKLESDRFPEISEETREAQLSWELYDHAGDIHYLTGDIEGAVELWEKALELEPDNEIIKKKVTNKAYIAQ